jgi:hypothetical protein
MEVCEVWLARDFLRRADRAMEVPPCDHDHADCPPIPDPVPALDA